ncbi:MAG TPA: hypothetical protein VGH93_05465 [Solirubrobacteraceae bacterium]
MREPREALEAARRAAATAPDAGDAAVLWSMEHNPVTKKQLVEWALIEPDMSDVYSTRRFGQPITAFKRLLIRLLHQYLGQISAQQSRFNGHVAARLLYLEERVSVLEEAALKQSASTSRGDPEPRGGDGPA